MAAASINERVNRLEDAITTGLTHIESLIKQEIRDLKTEQLAEIKQTIDRVERDLKGENNRLADDQRRLWDTVNGIINRESQRTGGFRAIHTLWMSASGALGGALGIAIDKLWK